MNRDTPLTEVAHHLPVDVLMMLKGKPEPVQLRTLQAVRNSVAQLEANGAQLDSVSYTAVVSAVGTLAIVAVEYGFALEQIQGLAQRARE